MASAFAAVKSGGAALLAHALSAALWFGLMAVAGAALLVVGTFILAGVGWALVSAGALCMSTAVLLLIGMTRGG